MTPMASVYLLQVGDLYEGAHAIQAFLMEEQAERALAAVSLDGSCDVALITQVPVWPQTGETRTIAQKTLREIQRWDAEGKTSYHPSA